MLAVILCGLLTRRISARAAKAGLLVGPVIFYLLNFSFSSEFQGLMIRMLDLSEPVHFLHILGIVFVVTLILMVLVSYRSPAPTPAHGLEQSASAAVDMTPWRYARLAGVLISAATIGTYVFLAQ